MALYNGNYKRNVNRNRRYSVIRECKAVQVGVGSLSSVGAHSMGIGRKWVEGKPTDTLCIRYYVTTKRPSSKLTSDEVIPDRISFLSHKTAKNAHIETDIIELPQPEFEISNPETALRPVPGGSSAGANGHAGTIGGWVWDATDDTIVMLSNDHVFDHRPGDDIVQPSTSDGGMLPADKIGEVKRGISRSDAAINKVDCSIGDPDDRSLCDPHVLDIGPAVFAIDHAEVDMLVEKYGQTSRHTSGEISDADWEGNVSGRSFAECFLVPKEVDESGLNHM